MLWINQWSKEDLFSIAYLIKIDHILRMFSFFSYISIPRDHSILVYRLSQSALLLVIVDNILHDFTSSFPIFKPQTLLWMWILPLHFFLFSIFSLLISQSVAVICACVDCVFVFLFFISSLVILQPLLLLLLFAVRLQLFIIFVVLVLVQLHIFIQFLCNVL